jgi:ABC-type branched-subunit amino acid transport system substrate-binding protein
VAANLFKTNVTNGIIGTFKINKNGDTTSNPVTIYKVKSGKSTEYKVIVPPLALVAVA